MFMSEKSAESLGKWFTEHPGMLRACTISLIIFSGWQFYRAVKLDRMAVSLIGEIQKAASEALGG